MATKQSDILAATDPQDVRSPVVDVRKGGENGLMPVPFQWACNGNYVQQHVRPFLLTPPALFQWADDPQAEVDALIAMIELWPIKIDGIDATLSVENGASTPMGNSGEVLESATRVSRAPSKPVYGYGLDRLNQTITRYWMEYVRMYVMDPDLTYAAICQKKAYIDAGSPVITPADSTFTVLYVEPDNTLSRPLKAQIIANHKPDGDIGEMKMYAERGASLQTVDVSITFTGYSQTGQAPLLLAQAILKSINLTELRPLELVGIETKIAARVEASEIGTVASIKPSVLPETFPEAGS